MMPTRMIYPGQVDKPYAGKAWLADWLDAKRDPYVLIPQPTDLVAWISQGGIDTLEDTFAPSFNTITLTRHKCWAPAPYVGAPYRYEWWVAVDEHGLGVGGREAYRQHILPFSSGFRFTDAEFCAALDRLEF
jgi:hypothetical protein